jgi:hypothetical protein
MPASNLTKRSNLRSYALCLPSFHNCRTDRAWPLHNSIRLSVHEYQELRKHFKFVVKSLSNLAHIARRDMNYLDEIEALILDLKLSNPRESRQLQELFNFTNSGTELLMGSVKILLSVRENAPPAVIARINELEQFCHSIGLFRSEKNC